MGGWVNTTVGHGVLGRAIFRCVALVFAAAAAATAGGQAPVASDAPEIRFRRHVLNETSEFSAAAVADFDRDGQQEIVAGEFRYSAPDWRGVQFRDIEQIRGRFDDYSNLPLDVDRDGWIDLVSANYRSESLLWARNPGQSDQLWERHVIDRPGPSETGRLVDINGDGMLDLLPNGTTFAAWYRLQAPSTWVRRELPAQLVGHGLGAGDIDGDGLMDVVGRGGWARQTRDAGDARWRWMDEFRLHSDASVPILVGDVDGDGDADLAWGRGHNVGLYWMEQRIDGGSRAWIQHVIDTSVAQIHAPLWGDLDGDSRAELIAGRRYLGHDGRDPGENDPLEIVVYRWNGATSTWFSTPISRGGSWGMDLDPKCADVDGDGDLDLVAPARSGLAWFENLRVRSDRTNREPVDAAVDEPALSAGADESGIGGSPASIADGYRHDVLLEELVEPGVTRPVSDLLAWGRRRQHIRMAMEEVMGKLPSSAARVPLDVQYLDRIESPRWVRHRITFRSDAQHRVPAYLYLPTGATRPTPAVLCLHPTSPLGKDIITGGGSDPGRSYALELADRGYVVLAPDYPSFGEYEVQFGAPEDKFVSGTMRAVWDNHRAVDLLQSLPVVDPDRIGCIGHSLGGHNALFTAAWDERLRAVVTSCGFTGFAEYYGGDLTGWTSDRYMPRIRDRYGSRPERMPFDFPEILGMIAPRPLWISAPVGDDNFDVGGVRRCVDAAKPVYQLFGKPDNLEARYPEAQHAFPDDVRRDVYEWLDRVL